jgi:hypothetical protein
MHYSPTYLNQKGLLSKCADKNISDELRVIEKGFRRFFTYHYDRDDRVNPFTEGHRSVVLDLIKLIVNSYDTEDIYLNEVMVAVLFAFYSLVLLELYGDDVSIEELCTFFRLPWDSANKIKEVYYGIAWSDHPVLANVRKRMLF